MWALDASAVSWICSELRALDAAQHWRQSQVGSLCAHPGCYCGSPHASESSGLSADPALQQTSRESSSAGLPPPPTSLSLHSPLLLPSPASLYGASLEPGLHSTECQLL